MGHGPKNELGIIGVPEARDNRRGALRGPIREKAEALHAAYCTCCAGFGENRRTPVAFIAQRCDALTMAYTGGKGRTYQFLINLMPPHRVYIETHLGAGSVLRYKRPADINIGIDKDRRVIDAWSTTGATSLQIVLGDAAEFLNSFQASGDELIFADPPYLARCRRRRRCYRFDYTIEDHERLLDVLRIQPCHVMITGVPDELYDERLAGWTRRPFINWTQIGPRAEMVWLNFEPGPILHDYRYIGDTFRDRERLRRRRDSLMRRITAATPLERNATLSDLADHFPEELLAAAARIPQ